MIDVRIGVSAPTARSFDPAKHRRALAKVLGPDFVERCTKRETPSYVRCALAATNRAELTTCRADGDQATSATARNSSTSPSPEAPR
jgi:hypothetical protein